MQQEESIHTAADGWQLFERVWRGMPRAAVVLVHGYAEHSGRYEPVAERLVRHRYAVYALDLRGHGRSEGRRALVRSMDDLVADVRDLLDRVRQGEPGLPLFLLGHSMGGAVVGRLLVDSQPEIAGVILSGAVLRGARGLDTVGQEIFSALGRLIPRLPTGKVGSEVISRDPAVRERYDNDPLVYRGRMPAGTLSAIIRASKVIDRNMESITLPLLILHGGADALVSPEGSEQLYERAGSQDKTLKLYEGLYHEILNEPEKKIVLDDIVAWLDERTAG